MKLFRRLKQWFKGLFFWRAERKKHLQLLESADQEISNMLAHVSQVEEENDKLTKALKERLKTDSESENYRAGLREGYDRAKSDLQAQYKDWFQPPQFEEWQERRRQRQEGLQKNTMAMAKAQQDLNRLGQNKKKEDSNE